MYALVYPAKGFRVRIGVAHKDHYGPYRPTRAHAEDDLAKVRARGRALTPCRGRAALQHDGRRDGPRLQLSALMLCVFEGCVRDVYCVDLGTGVHKIGLSTFAKD